MKKIAMISQTMGGKTEQEILQTRERAVAALTEKGYCNGYQPNNIDS